MRNAVALAHALGIAQPRVALMSAVETVTPGIDSTLDAAALCKMDDRGQVTGALLDGLLAFDNAITAEAARIKGIVSPVAGVADILVTPTWRAPTCWPSSRSTWPGPAAAAWRRARACRSR